MDQETKYTGETVADDEVADAVEREAAQLGKNYGTAGGSWVVDGNTDTNTLARIIEQSEEGEFYSEICPELSGPLSGEWADGYTLGRLSDELGVDQESDEFPDLCTIFEDAYYQAFEDEAVRSARASLPTPHTHSYSTLTHLNCPGCREGVPSRLWKQYMRELAVQYF